jgi:hypothetical protein
MSYTENGPVQGEIIIIFVNSENNPVSLGHPG